MALGPPPHALDRRPYRLVPLLEAEKLRESLLKVASRWGACLALPGAPTWGSDLST